MTITNKYNLPAGFVLAVSPKQHNEAGSLSATTLLKGVKEIILTERHWEEMTEDASDSIWAVFGTAVHALFEQEGESDFTEETLSTEVDGVKVTGRIDNYNMATGTIVDYKTATTWKVEFKDFEDWRRQGLIYAWLLKKNGFPVTKCRFIALLKDHSKTKAAGCDSSGSFAGTTWTATYDSGWSYEYGNYENGTVIQTTTTTLYLASGGTFTWTDVRTNLTTNETSTSTISGTWSLSGMTLALTMGRGNMSATYYGTYSDSTITITKVEQGGVITTMEEQGMTMIFTRVS